MITHNIELNRSFQGESQPFSPVLDYTTEMAKTILVVDDKANVRTLLREYLTEQGYRVVTAENGRIALFQRGHEMHLSK